MRANEFINEARDSAGSKELNNDQMSSLPGLHYWPELDNSSGYIAYRFGVAMAGMPDTPMNIAGPTGLKMVTIGYSKADKEIIDATAKYMKTSSQRLTPDGSTEAPDTNKVSPVSNWRKFK
jgi:hypothetical protein